MNEAAFPVFGADGEEGELGPELRCGLPVFRPHFAGDDAERGQREWDAIQMRLNPELALAHKKRERCQVTVRHYSELADDLANRVLAAQATAMRANQSLLHEEFLHPIGIGGPMPEPGPNNRLNTLLAEQREIREELSAAVEELQHAEKICAELLEKSGQLA